MARLIGYGGSVVVGSQLLEDCEEVWNELVDGDVTASLETSDVKVGSGSLKLVQAAPLADGDILATEAISVGDLDGYTVALLWAKSTVNITTADDYRLLLDNDASCVSPECELSFPVLTANVWKLCQLVVVSGSFAAVSAGISVGIKLQANDPGAATLYIDEIRAAKAVAGIKSWTLDKVMGTQETTGFDSSGHKTFIPTIDEWAGSFEGYKDGAPLTIGTIVALELRESSTATQQWRGSAIITGLHPSGSVDGLIMYTYDFQGTDELVIATT